MALQYVYNTFILSKTVYNLKLNFILKMKKKTCTSKFRISYESLKKKVKQPFAVQKTFLLSFDWNVHKAY